MMKARTSLSRFGGDIQGLAGNIALYRSGINEFYLSQYSWIYDQLETVRSELEAVGMYERCRDALRYAEVLVRQGTEYDEEAESLLLKIVAELAHASGSFETLSRKYRAANDAPKEE